MTAPTPMDDASAARNRGKDGCAKASVETNCFLFCQIHLDSYWSMTKVAPSAAIY